MSRHDEAKFSLLDPLPTTKLAIEASAGTGKTFALAALATRFIAETDMSAGELLVVTFTRAATGELRARIRDRLTAAAARLAAGSAPVTDDELLEYLYATDPAVRQVRLQRIERAITEFDAATITTIHGFAVQVLAALGTTADTNLDAQLVDDDDQLIADSCADVLVSAAASGMAADDLPSHLDLVAGVYTAINSPDIVIVPLPRQTAGIAMHCADLVRQALRRIELRRSTDRTMSFNDILVTLRDAVTGPAGGAVIEVLRNRFKVVLIDEFQDTDPVQWGIFGEVFTAVPITAVAMADPRGTALVLVGDPKQAIYSFRGANVHTYVEAVAPSATSERRSLVTNWRSDGAVLKATQHLLDGATFGDPSIAFARVDAAPGHDDRRLRNADGTDLPALSLRLAMGSGITRTKSAFETPSAERAINEDMVEQVRGLLGSALLPLAEGKSRPVEPSDIAVLVQTGAQADAVQAAFTKQGIPAVLARAGSVLGSPAAEQWRWLLQALSRPADARRARTAAMSWFVGWSPAEIDALTDERLAEVQDRLIRWTEILTSHGVTAFVRLVWADSGVMARVLARPDGDRAMTDLDHVVELMQSAHPSGPVSVAALEAVLEESPVVEIDPEVDTEVTARRIESEAKAVQIMTIWVAKGLEFPIVCCPMLWRGRNPKPVYVDPVTNRRTVDVSSKAAWAWPDKADAQVRKDLARREALGENLRLAYVALTRAQHQTMLWWSRAQGSDKTALARVLFARDAGVIDPERIEADEFALPDDDRVLELLQPLVDRSEGTIAMAMHGRPTRRVDRWVDPSVIGELPRLHAARLDHAPDRRRRRWSFTAITSHAAGEFRSLDHVDPYDETLADAGADDEQTATDDAATEGSIVSGSALAMLPAGAAFGTLVHSVFEEIDFADQNLGASLRIEVDRQLARKRLDLTPRVVAGDTANDADGRELLVAGLQQAIATPLGPLLGDRSLASFGRGDRLDEMSFDLLLGQAGGGSSVDALGAVLIRLLPDDHPLRPWADELASGALRVDLAGQLTGSIDAVLRVIDESGRPRFVVVDYKTNRLSAWGAPAVADDYRPDRLATAMAHHHYPLQALLYLVALHRYLRWRLRDYDPGLHLGGAAYLFVRGMTGPDVARADSEPYGVFGWEVPPGLVVEVSDLLDGWPEATRAS